MSVAQLSKSMADRTYQFQATQRAPRELEIVLNAPVGPQRLRDDTIVIDGNGWYRTLTPSASWPAANEVLFSNLDAQASEAEIDAIIAEYHERGVPLTWCVYPWTQPRNLGQRLLARGATKSVIEAFIGSTSLPLKIVEGVEVEQIDPTSDEAYDTYINLMDTVYRLPADELAFRRKRYRELSIGPAPCMRLFFGRYQGEIAGGGALIIKEDSGHMTGDFILPAFQARGIFPSTKAARLQVLRDLGIAYATGHGNEKSAAWGTRFGFQTIYSYAIYQLDPPHKQ